MDKIRDEIKNKFRSIFKLDKSFHVYVHGGAKDREKIEFKEDEKGTYVKLYYNEIR